MLGLFFQRNDFSVIVKLHYSIGTRVFYIIAEDAGTLLDGSRTSQHGREALSVKQVVAQDKTSRFAVQEFGTQHEGLRQSVRLFLYFIGE